MAGNNNPLYVGTPLNPWGKITAADTGTDGTGANVIQVDIFGSSGGFVQYLVFMPISTSGSTTTSAAAARVYLNNGSTHTSAGNNNLLRELSLVATAVNTSATQGVGAYWMPFNVMVQAGYTLYVGITAMAANTQWGITAFTGDY